MAHARHGAEWGASCCGGWVVLGSSEGALLALVTPILLHTQTRISLLPRHCPVVGAAAAHPWWMRSGRRRGWPATPTGGSMSVALALAALRGHRHSLIVVPFMLTALHTACVVTKYERAVTAAGASARHRQSHGLAGPGWSLT